MEKGEKSKMDGLNLPVLVHEGQRVLTTKQLAEFFGVDSQILVNNFGRNSFHYYVGNHYFVLSGDTKRDFLNLHQIDDGSKNAQYFYLWTERGAFNHAKSLGNQQAWGVFNMLVNTYYKFKEQAPQPTSAQALLQTVQLLVEQEKRIQAIEQLQITINHRVDNLDLTNIEGTPRQRLVSMVNLYARKNGILYNAAWGKFTEAFNSAYHMNLMVRVANQGRGVTRPDYLENNGLLGDAIRVMDKLLNAGVSQ